MYAPRLTTPTGIAGAMVDWNAPHPMGRWKPRSKGQGGSARFGAQQAEAYERSRDELVEVTIIFFESYWPTLRTALAWAQRTQQSFKFRFDQNTIGTEYDVVLETPKQGEELAPEPVQDTAYAFSITLVLRSSTGTPFDVRITTF